LEGVAVVDDEARTDERAPAAGPGRVGVAMIVVASLLVIVAAIFLVVGLQADSAAQDDRDRAAHLRPRERALESNRRAAQLAAGKMDTETSHAQFQLEEVERAVGALATAQNHFVDAYNRSADLHNQGDESGANALINGDVAAGVAEMDTKNAELQQQLQEAEAAVQRAAEALR
jgi:hypothetical protein